MWTHIQLPIELSQLHLLYGRRESDLIHIFLLRGPLCIYCCPGVTAVSFPNYNTKYKNYRDHPFQNRRMWKTWGRMEVSAGLLDGAQHSGHCCNILIHNAIYLLPPQQGTLLHVCIRKFTPRLLLKLYKYFT